YGRISLMWFLNEIQSGMAPEAQGAKVMTHWKPRLQLVAAVMVYEILLSCTYIYFITPVFQYTGFVYYPLPLWRMLLVHTIALVPVFWLAGEISKPSQIVEWFL